MPASAPSTRPIVVMGVSAAGKSAVGAALAQHLGRPLIDADDLHPPANVAKMQRGDPLTDADRWPWLDRVAEALAQTPPPIVACSALKRAYRQRLLVQATERAPRAQPWFAWLRLSPEAARARSTARQDHFMPAGLIDSQFATLEPLAQDEPGVAIDAEAPLEKVVAACLNAYSQTLG
ncbi:MAG: gluconokinase [Planctomycetota bacterium]